MLCALIVYVLVIKKKTSFELQELPYKTNFKWVDDRTKIKIVLAHNLEKESLTIN